MTTGKMQDWFEIYLCCVLFPALGIFSICEWGDMFPSWTAIVSGIALAAAVLGAFFFGYKIYKKMEKDDEIVKGGKTLYDTLVDDTDEDIIDDDEEDDIIDDDEEDDIIDDDEEDDDNDKDKDKDNE